MDFVDVYVLEIIVTHKTFTRDLYQAAFLHFTFLFLELSSNNHHFIPFFTLSSNLSNLKETLEYFLFLLMNKVLVLEGKFTREEIRTET
jgi:hypothetical protein